MTHKSDRQNLCFKTQNFDPIITRNGSNEIVNVVRIWRSSRNLRIIDSLPEWNHLIVCSSKR